MTAPVTIPPIELAALAAAFGVQTTYLDVHQRQQTASPQTLHAVLQALDVPLDAVKEARQLALERRTQLVRQGIDPIIVAWNGVMPEIDITVPASQADSRLRCIVQGEGGEPTAIPHRQRLVAAEELADDAFVALAAQDGPAACVRRRLSAPGFVTLALSLHGTLETGYHRLTVESPTGPLNSHIIAAPSRAFEHGGQTARRWGCFLPLYALRTGRDWGSGDFCDLADLRDWVRGAGGEMTATLPLLAAYLDDPCDPSPYAPASRLFWNEFYVAPERTAEFAACAEARRLFESTDFQAAIADLRSGEYVNYREIMRRKREVLSLLADWFFAARPPRFGEYQAFAARRPMLRDYAEFRATHERRRENWQRWPDRMRDGRLEPSDYDEAAAHYHCYVQWVANEQLHRLSDGSDGIDLDLPLGVRLDGYDVWRNPYAYASAAAAGAPPDAFFTKGQNWGFAPLHPEGIRRDAYRHVREFLTHHMESAATLRLDHVMSLRRLYWIPHGFPADQGAYVRYPMDELLAVLCLESHRHRTTLVGENLGTVPPEVNDAMTRHGLRKMFVVQYEFGAGAPDPLKDIPPDCVASVNTHDMPMFAAWWGGGDIEDRHDLGLLNEREMRTEQAGRADLRRRLIATLERVGRFHPDPGPDTEPDAGAGAAVRALLEYLAASPAEMVLVNLEDLWQETRPQNVPGTYLERPNWRRKTCFTLEQFREFPEVMACFREIERLRRGSGDEAARNL